MKSKDWSKVSPEQFLPISAEAFRMKHPRTILLLVLVFATLFCSGCCRRSPKSDSEGRPTAAGSQRSGTVSGNQPRKSENLIERPLDILAETGLNYSLDSRLNKGEEVKKSSNAFFEKQYLEGINFMEKGQFDQAVSVFEAIMQRYPNSEEASVAELCIAEMYFRNKSNDLALQVYKEIVEKYPNSHAAENALAGIKYLEDFEKYEQEYVPADVDDRKRRGF